MVSQRLIILSLLGLVSFIMIYRPQPQEIKVNVAVLPQCPLAPPHTSLPVLPPTFAAKMQTLRPIILAAAKRHNKPSFSGLSDSEFAEIIALLLYNEHVGWLEDDLPFLQLLRPFYEKAQVLVNQSELGSNFSVWPANLRPSVALEIIQQRIPLPKSTAFFTVPISLAGSQLKAQNFSSQKALFAAITTEIRQEDLAIEYLAANIERGVYRAKVENVPISWQTLAAWHNQGVVEPEAMCANGKIRDYLYRTATFRPAAQRLIAEEKKAQFGPQTSLLARP